MWKTISYEAQGRGHIKSGTVCQDKTYSLCDGNFSSIALADGAGSAKFSHHGAIVACKTACKYLKENFDILYNNPDALSAKTGIVNAVLEALQVEKTKYHKCEIDDLASTLLCVAVKDSKLMVFHIGDGVIGYIKNNEMKALSKPNNGEFANATYFITTKHAPERAKIFKGPAEGITGFILLSDGSAVSFYNKKEEQMVAGARRIIEWTKYIFKNKMEKLVKGIFDDVIINRTSDDCSIAVLANNNITDEQFALLNKKEKCQLFDKAINTQIKFLDERFKILKYINEPKSLEEIASYINLSNQNTDYRLKHLMSLGMVEVVNGKYKSDII